MDNTKKRCHYEGHLNSPITDDEVKFLLNNDEFYCNRHKILKKMFKEVYKEVYNFNDIIPCPWTALEQLIIYTNLPNFTDDHPADLNYLLEAAVWNVVTHHKAYYGVDMRIEEKIGSLKAVISRTQHQVAFKNKKRVEWIKSQLTEYEHEMGQFFQVSDTIHVEKELTMMKFHDKWYLFPTTMFMCVLDNIQARFYLQIYIDIKESEENIPGLFNHYTNLHQFIIYLREKYKGKFFELMKNWDALAIGFIVSDEIDDMGFSVLRDTLCKEMYESFDRIDVDRWVDFITLASFTQDKDLSAHLSLFFSNLCKNYGHPILNPIDGIAKLRENSKKNIDVDDHMAQRTLWKFRETYTISFYKKRGHYPNLRIIGPLSESLQTCLSDSRLPTKKEKTLIPLSDWASICLLKNHELALEIDEKELLKDTACAPPRDEWFIPYDPCAFKILYGQKKPRGSGTYEPRVLARYLKGDEGELNKKINEQENLYYNHDRDDIVQLCRKERELNVLGRVFCKQTFEMRLLQVCLEKSLSDNILPFVREQTMTNTELEVTKRMDKVASTISKDGNYNVNLDLSKWNQLQRHDLNKYIFAELDSLHGRKNLYSDSHLWFNRCMVLLSSRLTPPEIGPDGNPLEGNFCHYGQFGGFEGMRQKAWTLTTIMIIKLALEDCGLEGETMGQGDNQVIHLKLNKVQQVDPNHHIKLLLNTLDHYFGLSGLKLKLEETWYSKNLFEYSKVRFFKSIRIDDSLKRLNRLVPDINEGFPSLQSLLTSASTTTENLSRNCSSPCVPFLLYSLEAGNIMRRKGLLKPVEDKLRLPILLNSPSIFGGLPISNIYQHCQRGCPDPLPIWFKIWSVIRDDYPEVYYGLLKILPCTTKEPMDPIRLVEDMYSLNITGLPNFERRAREIVEEFLPGYVTNPHVLKVLGANRDDLERLCSILVTMKPFIANLAHEILKNSNEGVHLQLIGSFSNIQTINRMINEQSEEGETIFYAGSIKDKEAIQVLGRRFETRNIDQSRIHLVEDILVSEPCTFRAAQSARQKTWGFPINGITSPVPCEQIVIQDYDQSTEKERSDCIIAKVSHDLKTIGKKALNKRGPYTPYLGSSTPEKMTKPKLTVTCPNPTIKSIRKLYYIVTYLIRMDPQSALITLVRKMIDDKLKTLPRIFQDTPLEDWCGRNYGGSYEHRFKASSQKRSALYSLTTNLATHITINTNQLGKALRGNEDYNIFFQEIFLFIQNYISEKAIRGYQVFDTYAIPLNCKGCTYLIINQPISIDERAVRYQSAMMVSLPKPQFDTVDLTPCIRICTLAMSVSIGRRLSQTRLHESDIHDSLEAYGNPKTDESSERVSSNFMSEFRSCDINYLLVGALQSSKQLRDYILSNSSDYPGAFFEHLSYLMINSDRLVELSQVLGIKIEKHSSATQIKGMARVLAESVKNYILQNYDAFSRSATFTFFKNDLVSAHSYWWRSYLVPLVCKNRNLSNTQTRGIKCIPNMGGTSTTEWNNKLPRDERRRLSVEITFDENDAISVWRDLKGMINEIVGPISPLSDQIIQKRKNIMSVSMPRQIRMNKTRFVFSDANLHIMSGMRSGIPQCPIWVRYIHHISRPIGKISTSASKFLHVLGDYLEIDLDEGLIVALAEGSGGILHTLAHLFPNSSLIYNTLQNDTVEVKENVLNCDPPAFVGDQCDITNRLIGVKDLCLGESDITKEAFLLKLEKLLNSINDNILIWSMDAELKTDMTNYDKLSLYLPLVGPRLTRNGLLINKMFLSSSQHVLLIKSLIHSHGYECNIHKPPSSHPHNHEFYVVIFRRDSDYIEDVLIKGETSVGELLLIQPSLDPLLTPHIHRLKYFSHLLKMMNNNWLNKLSRCECISAIREDYLISEITRSFLTLRHQRNLILAILEIEDRCGLQNEETGLGFSFPFIPKDVLVSLLILSISLSLCKNIEQIISVLDTLSNTKPAINIIPEKKIELQLIPIEPYSDGGDSVIGILGNKIKDLMRTFNHFKSKPIGVPQLIQVGGVPMDEIESIRKLSRDYLNLIVMEGESGYTTFLNLSRK